MAELRDTKVPADGYEPTIERIRQIVEEAFEVRKTGRSRVVGAQMYLAMLIQYNGCFYLLAGLPVCGGADQPTVHSQDHERQNPATQVS